MPNRNKAHLLRAVGVSAALAFLVGCQTLLRPSPRERRASFNRVAANFTADADVLLRSTFFVVSSDAEFHPRLIFRGNVSEIAGLLPDGRAGLAVGLTPDGYLLTAAHVVKRFTYVLGWMQGRLEIVPVRPVTIVSSKMLGVEYALIKADRGLDAPARKFGDANSQSCVAVVPDHSRGGELFLLGGHVVGTAHDPETPNALRITTDLPFWRGDSGGPVFSLDGRLLGVITAFRWEYRVLHSSYERYVCAPTDTALEALIGKDRLRFQTALAP